MEWRWLAAIKRIIQRRRDMNGAENGLDGAPAGFMTRFAAFLIDGVLLMIPTYFSGSLLAIAMLFSPWGDIRDGGAAINDIVRLMFSAPLATFSLLYFTLGVAVWQTTVGKRMARLYVVAEDGSEIGGGRAFARALVLVLSAAPFGIGLIVSAIMIMAREDKRGLNDVICGTKVIRR